MSDAITSAVEKSTNTPVSSTPPETVAAPPTPKVSEVKSTLPVTPDPFLAQKQAEAEAQLSTTKSNEDSLKTKEDGTGSEKVAAVGIGTATPRVSEYIKVTKNVNKLGTERTKNSATTIIKNKQIFKYPIKPDASASTTPTTPPPVVDLPVVPAPLPAPVPEISPTPTTPPPASTEQPQATPAPTPTPSPTSTPTTVDAVLVCGLDTRAGDLDKDRQVALFKQGYGVNKKVKGYRYNTSTAEVLKFLQQNPKIPVFLFSAGCTKAFELSRDPNVDVRKLFIIEPYSASTNTKNIVESAIRRGVPAQNVFAGPSPARGSLIAGASRTPPNLDHWNSLKSAGQLKSNI